MLRYQFKLDPSVPVPPKDNKSQQVRGASFLNSLFQSSSKTIRGTDKLTKPTVFEKPEQSVTLGIEKFTASEIKRLGRRFKKLDSDSSGTVSLKEFGCIPEIKGNVFANRVVEIFDANLNGEVDFREFVLGMSQFSARDNAEGRLRFAFRIYDIDNDGFVSNGELFQVVRSMVGENITDVHIQNIVDHTFQIGDIDGDGRISFHEFCVLVKSNPTIRSEMVLQGF